MRVDRQTAQALGRDAGGRGVATLTRLQRVAQAMGYRTRLRVDGAQRRRSRDYEHLPQTDEASIYATMIRLML